MKATLFLIIITILFITNGIALTQQEGKSMSDKERWDQRYNREEYIYGKKPTVFLKDKIHLLKNGDALVFAMGEGRNAVYFAQNGFDVMGVDISQVAIEKCKVLAKEKGTTVNTVVADLTDCGMGDERYDLIANFYFYDKPLLPKAINALKPGGLFIFEQFSIDHPKHGRFGPKNPDYLVRPNELLDVFQSTRILYYEDTVLNLKRAYTRGLQR